MTPGRWRDQVLYLVMPASFRCGPTSTGPGRQGDLHGLRDAIPYLVDLGVTTLVMTPPFPSVAYHGYQHAPPTSICPKLGGDRAFSALVQAAHEAGLRIVIDLVAYGIDPRSLDTEQALDLAWENPHRTRATGYTARTWNGRRVRFAHWNLNHPRARQRVIDWARRWLDPDRPDSVDGLRLDHVWTRYPADASRRTDGLAPGSPPWADGWGYHLDGFWAPFAQAIRADRPDALLIAEPADWGSTGEDLLSVFDGVLAKPLQFALRNTVEWRKPDLWGRMQTDTPQGLIACSGDHDTDRLASSLPPRALLPALALLLLGAHPPLLYAGDELGMKGRRLHRLGGDAGDIGRREPFRWTSRGGWPESAYWDVIPRAVRCRANIPGDGISVEEQAADGTSILRQVRRLIGLRRDRVSLRQGETHVLDAPAGVWAARRRSAGETTLCLVNLTPDPVRVGHHSQIAHASGEMIGGFSVVVRDQNGIVLAATGS